MIVLRSKEEIAYMREAGHIVGHVLEILSLMAKVGTTTRELDQFAEAEIIRLEGSPAFKNYKGYPATICVSVNEEVVHGIPSNRRLRGGDLVSIDVGVGFRGYFADGAKTVGVGTVSAEAARLIDVTKKALDIGIDQAHVGNRLTDISYSVQKFVEANGFSVVRAFVGHGIGTKIHEEPEIPNFGSPRRGPRLESGMVLAIEPMVNAGTHEVEILDNGWTAVTVDKSLSAHFEHTVAIGPGGPLLLTVI